MKKNTLNIALIFNLGVFVFIAWTFFSLKKDPNQFEICHDEIIDFVRSESTGDGRIGVAWWCSKGEIDGGTFINFHNRKEVDEKRTYPLMSVFKFPLALAFLEQVDQGKFDLDHEILVGKDDLPFEQFSLSGKNMEKREDMFLTGRYWKIRLAAVIITVAIFC